MGRRVWSRADVDRLFELRDVQKLKWPAIADIVDDTAANCCVRYHYYGEKRRADALRCAARIPRPPAPAVRASTPEPVVIKANPPPPKPVRAAEIVHRPRYFHEADADIAARIRQQGITAGFLGDPPPGRSALDQRRP